MRRLSRRKNVQRKIPVAVIETIKQKDAVEKKEAVEGKVASC